MGTLTKSLKIRLKVLHYFNSKLFNVKPMKAYYFMTININYNSN